ncbi:hypothetical protein ABZ719_32770 [Streptomyces sp. NPDC006743]|uniref:hypothetical protein n=1 Tax=Streptomyces sp. NPDC006743 TaxID=3154480 RepID=UPI003454C3B1
MAHADQAPVLTPSPPAPSLIHPPPEPDELQRDRPVTRYEDLRQVPTDPTEHTRPRRLFAGARTVRRVEALRPRVTDVDADLVENL